MASHHDDKMTVQELRSFHRIDRDLYRYLTITLRKDPLVSMAVIALWMFMEELAYPIIILELLKHQSDILTNSAYDEAVWAIHYIITSTPPPPFYRTAVTDMPTTLSLIRDYGSAMYVSMTSLFEESGYASLKRIIGNVCYRMFADIFREALLKNGHGDDLNDVVNDFANEILEDTNIPEVELENSAPITGNVVEPESVKCEVGSSSGTAQGDHQRTLFVTFSRGFLISEDQIREFFVRTYGENCVESINMQDVSPPELRQPMYAMIVFHATETIDKILAGEDKVRFLINGRHIQARRLEVRDS
ncbi:hypothetical protein MKW92_006388 [Papaver armeniacum]|nr:hypothetical protein MKW92_006388 [Papaver armeniacum]